MAAMVMIDLIFMFLFRLRVRAGLAVRAARACPKRTGCLVESSLAGDRNEDDFFARIRNAQRRARAWIAPLQSLALRITNPAHWLVGTGREMQTFVARVVNNLGRTRRDELGSSDCRFRRRSILRDRRSLRRTIHSDARENQEDGGGGQSGAK